MILKEAKQIAEKYHKLFLPYCERVEIAGSIRRQKQDVKDIELVCIPKMETLKHKDIFGNIAESITLPVDGFCKTVLSLPGLKGAPAGKYTQRMLPEGIKLDIFITTAEQWGVIFMIRTGSAQFSQRMVTQIKAKGFFVKDGFLWKVKESELDCDSILPCYEEKEFFNLTGMQYLEPEYRSL